MKTIQFKMKICCICIFLVVSILKVETIMWQSAKNKGTQTEIQAQSRTRYIKKEEVSEKKEKVSNVEDGYSIMGDTEVTLSQMVSYFQESGYVYPAEVLGEGGAPSIETFCQIFLEESESEGIRAEIPYVQSMKETGWLQFHGVCNINQYNFAGIGATGGDVEGEYYPDVRTGIRAQIQHLKAYATTDPLVEACVDTRYEFVKKASAPYVEWLGQQENPQGCGWATDLGYGISIEEMIQKLKSF